MKSLFLLAILALASAADDNVPSRPFYTNATKTANVRSAELRQAVYQQLDCYDYFGLTGSSIRLLEYTTNLGAFNNRASSCCFNGIWLLYDDFDYNSQLNPSSAVFYAWGENYCTDFNAVFDNKASSVRFTGAPDGYKYDTINFYQGENFIGTEQYSYGDRPQMDLDNFGNSVVVTGCSPWTMYQYDNYQGQSVCIYPADTFNCFPGFYPLRANLGGLAGAVSSVRRGCFSSNVVRPPTKSTKEAEQQGQFGGLA